MPAMTTTHQDRIEISLADGLAVHLRPLRTTDGEALVSLLEAMSPESRRLRFLQAMPVVAPRLVRQLVAVDHQDHVAWLALEQTAAGDRCIGEVRCVRLRSQADTGEVAFAVADDRRRLGLGRLLLDTIGVAAGTLGIDEFTSTVSSENRASAALLASAGTSFRLESGALEGRGPAPRWSATPDRTHAVAALQRAASSALAFASAA
jgi:RimJ/RimL family protein N-acetyltransferase